MSVLRVIGTLTKIVRFREVFSRNKNLGSPTNHVPYDTQANFYFFLGGFAVIYNLEKAL